MIFGLLPLLILGGIVALVVRAVSNSPDREEGPTSLRRFFMYATLYGILVVVALGLSGLVQLILPESGSVIVRGSTDAARAIAFVVVGVPVYIGLAMWARRQLEDASERRSWSWSAYLTLALVTAALTAGWSVYETLNWLFGVADFDAPALSRAIVWSLVWAAHWPIARRYLDLPRGEGHLVAGAAVSLIALVSALGFVLFEILTAIYAQLFETTLTTDFGDDIRRAASALLVSGALWWIYWLRNTKPLERTSLWHGHVLLIGVFSGLSAAIGAGASALYLVLVWFVGDADGLSGVRHFDPTPALLSVVLVGLASFFYHRAVITEGGTKVRNEVRRIYEYVIAALGLLSAAVGMTILLVIVIQELAATSPIIAVESQLNVVLGAVTALAVGIPLWATFWRRIQRIRFAEPAIELRSPTRRSYLGVLFGLGGIVALTSIVIVAFRFVEDMLDGVFGGGTINDVAPALALVLTTGAIAAYHWFVYKEDRSQKPPAVKSPLREVVLVGAASRSTARELTERLDVRVRSWDRADGGAAPVNIEALSEELANLGAERVIVVARVGGHEVIPFTEAR